MSADQPAPVDEMIGRTIRHLLVDRDMPQTALVPVLGLSQSVVSRKLRGKLPWTAREIVVVAAALGVKPAELLEATRRYPVLRLLRTA